MATTLYFRNTTAAEPKPNVRYSAPTPAYNANHYLTSTLGGGQDDASNIYPCDLGTTIGASNATITKTITEPGIAHKGWVKAFVSPALSTQTISGTFTLSCDYMEGNNLQNMNPMIYIYVWKGDDTGQRGDLYGTAAVPIVSTLESDTSQGVLQSFTFASYTLASLGVTQGDRIVIEMSFYDNSTKTSSYGHGFGLNGAASSGYESSITFSMTIAWYVAPCEAYATEVILDYKAPCEAYASEAILAYNAPCEAYATEAILAYSVFAEAYATEAILDYVPSTLPCEVYATEAILNYELPPCEVYAAEAILDYIGLAEVYAAETILNYEPPPCEAYAAEAILNYMSPAEVYAAEVILNYEFPPCEVYAAEAILDYALPPEPCEAYAAEGILNYNPFMPCEAYATEAILDYEPPPADPCEVYATEVILQYLTPAEGAWYGWIQYIVTHPFDVIRKRHLIARGKGGLKGAEDFLKEEWRV